MTTEDHLTQVVDLLTIELETRPDPFLEVIRDMVVGIAMKRAELDAAYPMKESA